MDSFVSLSGFNFFMLGSFTLAFALILFFTLLILYKGIGNTAKICFTLYSFSFLTFLGGMLLHTGRSLFGDPNPDFILFTKIIFFSSFPIAFQTLVGILDKPWSHKFKIALSYLVSFTLILLFFFVPREIIAETLSSLFFAHYNISVVPDFLLGFFGLIASIGFVIFAFLPRAKIPYMTIRMKARFWFVWLSFFALELCAISTLIPTKEGNENVLSLIFVSLAMFFGIIALLREQLFEIEVKNQSLIISTFTISGVTLSLCALNFYHVEILNFFPFLSLFIFPIFSILLTVLTGFALWQRGKLSDQARFEFINVVTHQFRTPLTHIKWSTDEMRRDQKQEERIASLNQIEEGNERLVELVNILSGISRAEESFSYVWSAISPREMIQRALSIYNTKLHQKQITLSISIPGDLPLITADVDRLNSVVQTIIENAITYTPEHGSLFISASRKKNSILFAFQDTGIGISKKDMPHIFKSFYRGKEAQAIDMEGVGLALYIAKSIIDRHGGKIWAESEGEKKGSTFYLELAFTRI